MDLPGFEEDFDLLVTEVLGEGHLDTIFLFRVVETGLFEEGLNIFELGVVVVFVFDFVFEGFGELGTGAGNEFN